MSRYVKSISDTAKLTKSLNELKDRFSYHQKVVEKNNKELQKINNEFDEMRQKEIQELEEKMKKLENQSRWVQESEPAVKVTDEYLLKKLNIL